MRHWHNMTTFPANRIPMAKPRVIAFLLYDDVNVLDVTGPLEVFSQPCRMSGAASPPYRILVVSLNGGMVRTSAGLPLMTEPLAILNNEALDTVIVPGGGHGYQPFAPQAVVDWIAAAAPRVRRLCSVCTGAFALAAAGLLANRRATTHWLASAELHRREPLVRLQQDAIYVHDGKIWTSAGVSAGIDLALALIEADLGHALAMQVARRMVVFLKRPGGQSQFSVPLHTQEATDTFSELHAWIASHLREDLRVERLAERVNMSPRTFARVYAAKVKRTPARTVETMRLEAACGMLEETDFPLKRIALDCGIGDEQNLRRAFQRQFGINPLDYRGRFAAERISGAD
jgi:transcriptional regulator GlxA family with amidase domain